MAGFDDGRPASSDGVGSSHLVGSGRKDEKGPSAIGWISEFLTGCWENATSHFDYSSLSLVDFDFAPPSLFVQLTQAMMTHMRWMRSLKLM